MRIAFVTDEFPPDSGGGGIGTYLTQAVRMLAARGQAVEVFARSEHRTASEELLGGGIVHWVKSLPDKPFRDVVVPVFLARHALAPFDVLEGSDYNATALGIKAAIPRFPYVVKLHTPGFLVEELHSEGPLFWSRVRMHLGALRRFKLYRPGNYRDGATARSEIEAIRCADVVASPSHAISDALVPSLNIDPSKVKIFPYCFEPHPDLLQLPPPSCCARISYFGRLELRKGVIELASAFAHIAGRFPEMRLRFVGRDTVMPRTGGRMMSDTIRTILKGLESRYEIKNPVPNSEVIRMLGECDVVVIPSHWESFGLICCEALAAGRYVVSTSGSGLAEILDQGRYGRLAAPKDWRSLAEQICSLVEDPIGNRRASERGRLRLVEFCSSTRVYEHQMKAYEAAIAIYA